MSIDLVALVATAAAIVVAPPAPDRAPPEIRYLVAGSAGAADLTVEAELPPGLGSSFTVDPDAAAFVDAVAGSEGGRPPVPARRRPDGAWSVPTCERAGCRIRYVFHLAGAARAIVDPDVAAVRGGALVAPASAWLLSPSSLPAGGLRGRMHVTVPPPLAFVTGLPPAPDAADTFEVALLPSFLSPYSAFGRFDDQRLDVGGASIELAIAMPDLSRDAFRLRPWVLAAARAVSAYFGRFPVERALVLAVPQAAGLHGKAMGGGGATVLLQLAPGTDLTDPGVVWQAAHEMVHLAVPEMARAQIWLTEGLATYIEPLARSMTGELAPESVWRDMMLGLPKGLPGPGDRGLDRTHTWGRTYWGGALFALLADLEIRKATHGEQSLATALAGVLRAGGDARVLWSVERFASACDRAVGRPVVTNLYRRMAVQPVDVDLPALWRELGVSISGHGVALDDRAPLAPLRRAMTRRPALDPAP